MAKQRGRKSKADLAIVNETTVSERPRPPASLNAEQKMEWVTIVNDFPANYFGVEMQPMLEAFCLHRVALRHISQLINSIEHEGDDLDMASYDKSLKMQERESRCIASLAVRLGFAHSTARGDTKQTTVKKPWED